MVQYNKSISKVLLQQLDDVDVTNYDLGEVVADLLTVVTERVAADGGKQVHEALTHTLAALNESLDGVDPDHWDFKYGAGE